MADFVAVGDTGARPCDVLAQMSAKDVEMVVVGGCVKLLAERFRDVVPGRVASGLHRVRTGDASVLVDADIPRLTASASAALGEDLRLAGKRILT